jgi:hypothetical protein
VRRLFWLTAGVTIGALVVRKISKTAQKLTPRGLADSIGTGLAELADALREFGTDVRAAMREREDELRQGTGLDGQLGTVEQVDKQ